MAVFEKIERSIKNGKTIVLRSLNSGDASFFRDYLLKISHESTFTYQYPGKEYSSDDEYKVTLKGIEDHPFNLYLGAFEDGKLIAMGNVRREQEGHPWVPNVATFGMTVLKSHWGLGVGKVLLRGLIDQCKKNEILRLEARVRTNNPRGIALYKKEGFLIEGTRSRCAQINGEYVDEYFIVKFLDKQENFKTIPTIEKNRLTLRPLILSDAEAIFEYAKNPEVSKYTLWEPHKTVEDAKQYITEYATDYYNDGEPEPLGIVLKDSERVIGTVGAFWNSKKSMELAYALSMEFWGKGIATEASIAIMDYCFNNFEIERFQSRCKAPNIASARVMEKIGMSYEGTLRKAIFHRGTSWDMKYYSILRDEWIQRKELK